jgi:precorrin-6B methylase 2
MVSSRRVVAALCLMGFLGGVLNGQDKKAPADPQIGQPGKDVIWVPTPPELVEKMLDLAEVTPRDFVVDLGSGDGRMVIAAAKRGAKALGIEYDANLVEVSKRSAAAAGVGGKAKFVRGDMFTSDFSKASVLALFLLPSNLLQLRSKFLSLAPGTRIVVNNFEIAEWRADATAALDVCDPWCTARLWIVPANVEGTWTLPQGELALTQRYQTISGTLSAGGEETAIASGSLRGDEIRFTAGTTAYTGRVEGKRMEGTATSGGVSRRWKATRR